jgi:hypothetical protein
MMEDNKKIPAFPTTDYDERMAGIGTFTDNPGMTLRDYFAAKALQALITGIDSRNHLLEIGKKRGGPINAYTCALAYEYADMMLIKREA